jgi:hypothetical protein
MLTCCLRKNQSSSRVIKLLLRCFLVSVVDCCLLHFVIMSSVSPAPKVLKCWFLAKDALLGQTWLQSTCIPLSSNLLHHLVLASNNPLIVKARDTYGHFRTASQMNKVPRKYWQPEAALSALIQQESLGLNPQSWPLTHWRN